MMLRVAIVLILVQAFAIWFFCYKYTELVKKTSKLHFVAACLGIAIFLTMLEIKEYALPLAAFKHLVG